MAIDPHFMPNTYKAIRNVVATTVPDLKKIREEFVKNSGGTDPGIISYKEEELSKILPNVVKSAIVTTDLYEQNYETLLRLIYKYIERFRVADNADHPVYPYEIINRYVQLAIDRLYDEVTTKTTIASTMDKKILKEGLASLKSQSKRIIPWADRQPSNYSPPVEQEETFINMLFRKSFLPGVVDESWMVAFG